MADTPPCTMPTAFVQHRVGALHQHRGGTAALAGMHRHQIRQTGPRPCDSAAPVGHAVTPAGTWM